MSTACTRRLFAAPAGSSSLRRIWRTCVSTVFRVSQRRSAIPRSVSPSAISARISRSRGVSLSSGSRSALPRKQPRDQLPIDDDFTCEQRAPAASTISPGARARDPSAGSRSRRSPSLEQTESRSSASTYCERTSTPTAGCRSRIAWPPRRALRRLWPEACGCRRSRRPAIADSTSAISSGASPASPHDLDAGVRRAAAPGPCASSVASSAITTRTGSPRADACRPRAGSRRCSAAIERPDTVRQAAQPRSRLPSIRRAATPSSPHLDRASPSAAAVDRDPRPRGAARSLSTFASASATT